MFVFPMTREIARVARRGNYDLYRALVKEVMVKGQDPGIEYVHIPARKEVLHLVSVTLGARATTRDRIIASSLTKELALENLLRESTLTGAIRYIDFVVQ